MVFTSGKIVSVWFPLFVEGAYDYLIPENMTLQKGSFVLAPLGTKSNLGIVWSESENNSREYKLKQIISVKDLPPLPVAMMSFLDWISDYTMQPKGIFLKMAIAASYGAENFSKLKFLELAKDLPNGIKLTNQRRKVLDFLNKGGKYLKPDLAIKTDVNASVIEGLIRLGAINIIYKSFNSTDLYKNLKFESVKLEPNQNIIAKSLSDSIQSGFSVSLLEGVTGSGKTEVCFEPIAKTLRTGFQVLVLVPEISLSSQWINRFSLRFDVNPNFWHSGLSSKSKSQTWLSVIKGEVQIIIGARSALFLPFSKLGLIVIDEEHDSSFKQEDRAIYNARDMAIVRAKETDVPIILASATPSIETIINARAGKYNYYRLPNRAVGAMLPKVEILDLLKFSPEKGSWGRGWLSPPLVSEIDKTLELGDQVFLFLNRRGYAPMSLCSSCGYRLSCSNCSAWLVDHRIMNNMKCHHCGFVTLPPNECSSCGSSGSFIPCGPGVERVAEEAKLRWPNARIELAASDMFDKQSDFSELLLAVEKKEVDVIVGTQMLAKGHHFPSLTLVGVVDADLGLYSWDLRASERVHQLLVQVSGRAGRANKPGRVLMQSYDANHPVFQSVISSDQGHFMEREINERKSFEMPPFGRLVAIIFSSKDEGILIKAVNDFANYQPRFDGIEVLGPAPAVMALLRGNYRYRFLIKGPKNFYLQPFIKHWLSLMKFSSNIHVQIDVDPYSFF